jgi:hypothetical protein
MCPFTGKSGFTKYPRGTKTNLHEESSYDFLLANIHALESRDNIEVDPNGKPFGTMSEDDNLDTHLINAAKSKGNPIPPCDVCCVMSKSSTRHVNFAQTQYHFSFHESLTLKNKSLNDQGENDGVTGEVVCVIFRINCTINIKGIDKSSLQQHCYRYSWRSC